MFINRNAAPVIRDREAIAFIKPHLNPRGMACHSLVHRVVEHFGSEVVERAFIGSADIHAGAAANRLKPFENFDGRGIVIAAGGGGIGEQVVWGGIGHSRSYRPARRRLTSGACRFCSARKAGWRSIDRDNLTAAHFAHFKRAFDHTVAAKTKRAVNAQKAAAVI